MRFSIHIGIIVCVFLSSIVGANNNVIKVGIYNREEPKTILVSPNIYGYTIIADKKEIGIAEKGNQLQIANVLGKIQVKLNGVELGKFSRVYLKRTKWGACFKLKPLVPKKYEHQYPDELIISPLGTKLRLINQVYIDHYIAGVVESESGSKQNEEYYKVQSIICRTYVLANKSRHSGEGFNICDKVHCQVFHGKSRFNPIIKKAAFDTKGIVVVDSDINLITAGFHSNCGGQTINSEDAWRYPVSYLKSVCDTFCTDMPHASWEATIPREKWANYFRKYSSLSPSDSLEYPCIFEHLPENRQKYFTYLDSSITTPQLRIDWKLRSAHFYTTEICDSVKIIGNGFGHGIGLCQEGAMKMSTLGYSYNDILHFYYSDVHLIELKNLDFFKD